MSKVLDKWILVPGRKPRLVIFIVSFILSAVVFFELRRNNSFTEGYGRTLSLLLRYVIFITLDITSACILGIGYNINCKLKRDRCLKE
jgi:hypothetical protein